jgi:hypothetical protein
MTCNGKDHHGKVRTRDFDVDRTKCQTFALLASGIFLARMRSDQEHKNKSQVQSVRYRLLKRTKLENATPILLLQVLPDLPFFTCCFFKPC